MKSNEKYYTAFYFLDSNANVYCTVDLDTMHQLHHQTMPTVLLHLAGHCEHKIT